MDGINWWIAFALLLVFEGIGPLMFPQQWRQMIAAVQRLSDQALRQIGVALVTIGLLLLWLVLKQNG